MYNIFIQEHNSVLRLRRVREALVWKNNIHEYLHDNYEGISMLYPGRQTDPAGTEPVTLRVRTRQTVETLGDQILSHLLQILIGHVLIYSGLVR